MCTRATIPSTSPTREVTPHVSNPRQANTSEVTAIPLVLGGAAASWDVGVGGAGDAGPAAEGRASANSGKSVSGFHSVEPAACSLERALARPCAIHARICSALTGPYSFW